MALDSLMFNNLSSAVEDLSHSAVARSGDVIDRSVVYSWVDKLIDMGIALGTKLLVATVIFIVGRWLLRRVVALMIRVLERNNADLSLRSFLKSLVSVILNIVLILTIVSVLGVNVTSFLALFGAAGVAIGLALSNTLQNFANGVIILLLKPYKVGDFITAQGESGTVSAIQITSTEITTNDRRVVIIPNGTILSGVIQNYSRQELRRVDFTFGVAYGTDFQKAREVILQICNEEPRILHDPKPFVELSSLADSAVELTVRVFVKSADYWDIFFLMNKEVYRRFNAEGISIPFPQMDVHMVN